MTFGWWEAVLRDKKPFDAAAWSQATPALESEPEQTVLSGIDLSGSVLVPNLDS
jgi:hypothetical protein